MSCILEGLYLGGLDDVHDTDHLHDCGITHILTLNWKPLPIQNHEAFIYKYVHALDIDTADLLSHFEECIQFIDKGRESGGVIVHCFAGCSRSTTIVLAYIMNKLYMNLEDSFSIVRKMRPQIRPNPGFHKQLELYEMMGNKVDKTHKKYKMFHLANLGRRMQIEKFEHLSQESFSEDPNCRNLTDEAIYKCRKCRRALFSSSGLLPHISGKGESAFDWRNRLEGDNYAATGTECKQSFFIEPVEWMSSRIQQLEGKINCPKCAAKVGYFNWSGSPCQCGTWVTPAFHINTGKVDFCKPRIQLSYIPPESSILQKSQDPNDIQEDSDSSDYVCMDHYLPKKQNLAEATGVSVNEELPPLD